MSNVIPFNRDRAFLLPPDLKAWLREDDVAHFVVAAVERVPLGAFRVMERAGGKPPHHPRLLLALLIYGYSNGIFSSRRIERAIHRDIGVRFVAANLHPDHDTIAVFPRGNKAAFLKVGLLARESGLLRVGTVSIDGTKIDANASKIRSARYDRANDLRARLTADIAALTAQAEAADAARRGRCGRPPTPPDDAPPPARPGNLTDPDSALMRRSGAHEFRQADNAQAVMCADGAQPILATAITASPTDAASFAASILATETTIGLPQVDAVKSRSQLRNSLSLREWSDV